MDFDTFIYTMLFLTSVIYAVVLQWWWRADPDGFDDNTWLTVVIGVGYVLLWLRPIIPLDAWLDFGKGFMVAGIPIVFRSLYNNARRNRRFQRWLERFKGDR